MPSESIFDRLFNKEIFAIRLFMSTKTERSALTIQEYIRTRVSLGADLEVIKKELLDDLNNNGRIFSEFRRAIKSTARGSVNRVRDNGYFSEFGVDTKYRWSAVLVKTCPDCLERHGRTQTWDEWEAEGLPRTGATVCRENCHCVLIPVQYSEIAPINRR
jgi:hypothetical protein